jgi:hypothetical protein
LMIGLFMLNVGIASVALYRLFMET